MFNVVKKNEEYQMFINLFNFGLNVSMFMDGYGMQDLGLGHAMTMTMTSEPILFVVILIGTETPLLVLALALVLLVVELVVEGNADIL